MQRAGETGQLLPTITPFNGVQQDPMGYDALPRSKENFVKMANYQNRSSAPMQPQKENFKYMPGEKPSQV